MKIILLAVGFVLMLGARETRAQSVSNEPNRVLNGDFESGNLDGWITNAASISPIAHSGNFGATFTGANGLLRQLIFSGSQYDGPFIVSFWLMIDPAPASPQSLWVRWGGAVGPYIFIISNSTAMEWTRYSILVIGQHDGFDPNMTSLNFELVGSGSGPSNFHLDDIAVQAVPDSAASMILMALGSAALFATGKYTRSLAAEKGIAER